MSMYSKREMAELAAEYGFQRDTFEKVLRLKKVLEYFQQDALLNKHLVLKGGTAINLTIFSLPRLSVDIDMDYVPNDSREDMLSEREKISETIKNIMEDEGYQLAPNSRFSHSLDAFHYQYQNSGGNHDLLRKAIVFYATISAETVNRTFDTSAIDSLMFAKIRRDLFPVLTRVEARDHFELEQYKTEIKTYLKELMDLTDTEKSYMDRFIEGDYRPELLFDDEAIVARLKKHPMAIWKCATNHNRKL